jgi:undecaprenyl-diphosphatase
MMQHRPWFMVAFLFAVWVAVLIGGGIGSGADRWLIDVLHAGHRPMIAAAARVLTPSGGWLPLSLLSFAAALVLAVRDRRRDALLLLVTVFAGRLLVEAQKWAVGRARPPEEHLVAVSSMSFPSGHAANSMIVLTAVALLLFPRTRVGLSIAICLSLLIGLTRPMLGVHWPSDVVGGWAFGLGWTLLLLGTPDRLPSLKRREESEMSDNKRADAARDHDDSDLIDAMEDAPSQSGSAGGNLHRDIGTRAEIHDEVGDGSGVTRVRDKDKPAEDNLPRFNQS